MIGTAGAVDAGSAAELGDERDHRLAPGGAHIAFYRRQRAIERTEQLRQPAIDHAFIDMRIPAVERQRPDARPLGIRQDLPAAPATSAK